MAPPRTELVNNYIAMVCSNAKAAEHDRLRRRVEFAMSSMPIRRDIPVAPRNPSMGANVVTNSIEMILAANRRRDILPPVDPMVTGFLDFLRELPIIPSVLVDSLMFEPRIHDYWEASRTEEQEAPVESAQETPDI